MESVSTFFQQFNKSLSTLLGAFGSKKEIIYNILLIIPGGTPAMINHMELHSSLDIDRVRHCPSGACGADSKQMHYKMMSYFYLTLQALLKLKRIGFRKVSFSFRHLCLIIH